VKKSTLLSAIVGALAIVGGLTGGTSYLGNAQGELETQAIVESAVNSAITQMEQKVDERSHRIERKFDQATANQNARLDKIDTQVQEIKLDVRDIQRDVRDLNK
jgi:hypothetical protein